MEIRAPIKPRIQATFCRCYCASFNHFTHHLTHGRMRLAYILESQGRYKAILVEKQAYLLELARYIVLNPVRAKMVRSAKDWKWSPNLNS